MSESQFAAPPASLLLRFDLAAWLSVTQAVSLPSWLLRMMGMQVGVPSRAGGSGMGWDMAAGQAVPLAAPTQPLGAAGPASPAGPLSCVVPGTGCEDGETHASA